MKTKQRFEVQLRPGLPCKIEYRSVESKHWSKFKNSEANFSQLPNPFFRVTVSAIAHCLHGDADKSFHTMKPLIVQGLIGAIKLMGGEAKTDTRYADVTWMIAGHRYYDWLIIDQSSQKITRNWKSLAADLRKHDHYFKRMERKSKARLRGAIVVLGKKGFRLLVPGRVRGKGE